MKRTQIQVSTKMMRAAWTGWLTLLLLPTAMNAATSTNLAYAMRHPTRSVNRVQVSLTPLFTWWKAGGTNGNRPMLSWERVTCGDPEKMVAGGWIVEARIEEMPGAWRDEKIMLKHPPLREWQQFHKLQSAKTNSPAAVAKSEAQAAGQTNQAATSQNTAKDSKDPLSGAGYQMDTFALRTAQKYEGLTVYEVGYVPGW